jgi:hypothetical protein
VPLFLDRGFIPQSFRLSGNVVVFLDDLFTQLIQRMRKVIAVVDGSYDAKKK